MIKISDNLWIGDSHSDKNARAAGVRGVLNVAQDLHGRTGWDHGIDYMQIGLIDGPGNTLAAYYAATLALAELMKRGPTLIFCHTGGRSLAVVLMYLSITSDHGWDSLLEMLQERVEVDLPVPHEAHRKAYDKMDWGLLMEAAGL